MISLIARCFMTLPNSVVSHSVIQRSTKKTNSQCGGSGLLEAECYLAQDHQQQEEKLLPKNLLRLTGEKILWWFSEQKKTKAEP